MQKFSVLSLLLLVVRFTYSANLPMLNGDVSVLIDSRMGVLSESSIGGVKNLSSCYDSWFFQNGEDFFYVSEKDNSVTYNEYSPSQITLKIKNSNLQKIGIGLETKYYWSGELLIKRVRLLNNSGKGYFVSAKSNFKFYKDFYSDGTYYVPNFDYKPAESVGLRERITSKRSDDLNTQMISLYSKDCLVGSFCYTRDSSPVFPESVNQGVSFYVKGGWELSSYYDYIANGETAEYEVAIVCSQSSPSKMIRMWPELDTIRTLRKQIFSNAEQPYWLEDVCITGFVYEPSQLLNNYNFKNSVGTLSNSLPGYYLVVYWGASMQASGDVYQGEYGSIPRLPFCQPIPPQQADKDWAISGLPLIRRDCPKIKIGHYVAYHWCIDENSEEASLYPDWKAKNHYDEAVLTEQSRALRNVSNSESRAYCSHMTRLWYEDVPLDFNYVDGGDGKYLLHRDWLHNTVTRWSDWHLLFKDIYETVHASNLSPKMQVNNGQSVISDFIIEELTNPEMWEDDNWRCLADSLERAKLWQPSHGYTSVLYWTDQNTGSLKNDNEYITHILSYGLLPNLMPNNPSSTYQGWCMDRIPYIEEAYNLRKSEIVYPSLSPDWRSDRGDVESVILKLSDSHFRINVINHSNSSNSVKIEFDFGKLNINAESLWCKHRELIAPVIFASGNYSDIFIDKCDWAIDCSISKKIEFEIVSEFEKLSTIDILIVD